LYHHPPQEKASPQNGSPASFDAAGTAGSSSG
jgi:hypothetical protein